MTVLSSKSLVAAALGAIALSAPLSAQGGGGAPGGGGQQRPPENLQVLPKDTPRDQLTPIMRGFTAALGVNCAFCHAEREGAPAAPPAAAPGDGGPGGGGGGPPLNYALDTKDQKKTARIMLKMVDSVNKILATVPTRDMGSPVTVSCITCHRGVAKPMTIEMVLAQTIEKNGVDSAIARYRGLRTDVAAGRYNFTEQPVTVAAQRLAAQGKHDDALKLLQMNLEYNPTSTNVDNEIADVLIAKKDSAAGIARLRAILQKAPNDRRARQRLTALGVTP